MYSVVATDAVLVEAAAFVDFFGFFTFTGAPALVDCLAVLFGFALDLGRATAFFFLAGVFFFGGDFADFFGGDFAFCLVFEAVFLAFATLLLARAFGVVFFLDFAAISFNPRVQRGRALDEGRVTYQKISRIAI